MTDSEKENLEMNTISYEGVVFTRARYGFTVRLVNRGGVLLKRSMHDRIEKVHVCLVL
jgi:hypothetical protein